MVARALGVVAIVGFLVHPALDQAQAGEAELAAQDMKFAEEAAAGGLAEVALGELAEQKAKHAEVAQFGERMVRDHQQANQKLMAIVEQKGIELPQDLPQDAKQKHDKLQQLSDAEFDQAYMDEMVKDHEKTVQLFEQQAESGEDGDLRAFAEETLPTLQEHLDHAKELQQQVTALRGSGPEQAASIGMTPPAA
jgi:putative membrane protein